MSLADYPHRRVLGTRWADNDIYGHVNNVEFYALFDTLINAWLIREGGLDIHGGPVIGLCAESHCRYHAPEQLTGALDALLADAGLSQRLAGISARLRAAPGTIAAADIIERVAA